MAQQNPPKNSSDPTRRRRGNPRQVRYDARTSVRFDNFDRLWHAARLTQTTVTELIRVGAMKEAELRIKNAARKTG